MKYILFVLAVRNVRISNRYQRYRANRMETTMNTHVKPILADKIRAGLMALATTAILATTLAIGSASADNSGLPDPGFEIVQGRKRNGGQRDRQGQLRPSRRHRERILDRR